MIHHDKKMVTRWWWWPWCHFRRRWARWRRRRSRWARWTTGMVGILSISTLSLTHLALHFLFKTLQYSFKIYSNILKIIILKPYGQPGHKIPFFYGFPYGYSYICSILSIIKIGPFNFYPDHVLLCIRYTFNSQQISKSDQQFIKQIYIVYWIFWVCFGFTSDPTSLGCRLFQWPPMSTINIQPPPRNYHFQRNLHILFPTGVVKYSE